MELRDVRYETDGPLALVTLDRPRYRNAQSWRLLDELDLALDRAQADRAIAAVVVRGAGEHFSAGHDLGTPEQSEDYKARDDENWLVHSLIKRPAGVALAPKGDMQPEINTKKKVDMSLAEEDPRFLPKERVY